jgi:hypothetical protein
MKGRSTVWLQYSLVICLLFPLWTTNLNAQVNVANLNGTITDPSGAVVPNARVEVVSPDTGFRRQVEAGEAGVYSITDLPIGTYDVTISHEGFETFDVRGIKLFIGQVRTLNARLRMGAATARVEVTGTAQGLETTNAEVGVVLEHQQLSDIPLNGRSWALLAMLAPGAISSDGTQYNLHFVGRGRDDNNFTFDGIDATGIQEQSQKADARLNISLESIAEFRVNSSNYTADSGSAGGAQVNAVSQTGTNAFHGGLFEFLRNDKFDARSDFDPSHIPPFRMNQFGGSLGGPIKKNRTFFFVDYEGIRQHLTGTMIGFVPNAAYRAQVLATSPVLEPILNGWPIGQIPIDATTNQYTAPGLNAVREDSGTFRLDHKFNENTSLFVRGNTDDVTNDTPADNIGSRSNESIRPSNLVLALTHVFSPTIVNEAKFGINRSAFHHMVIGTAPVGASVPGFDGLSMNALDLEVGTTFSWIDDLTVVKGRHTFKMGAEIRRIRLNNTGEGLPSTSLTIDSQAAFVNNSIDSVAVNSALSEGGMRRTFWMGYGQDDFKVRPNLTLNLGVRYEYYSVVHEVFGRQAIVDFACGGFCPPGTPAYSPIRNDFAPRLGLAWTPAGANGKTVIRTGFGMYFSANQMDDFSDIHESTATRYALSSADVPGGLSYPLTPFLPLLVAQGANPKGIDRHRRNGYYENWDFMVQRQLPRGFTGQLGYVGGEGHKIWGLRMVNLINPIAGKRPLPDFDEFGIKYNNNNSNFHALQASLERNLTSGWLWQTQYQWAHSIADGTAGTGDWAGSWGGGGAGSGLIQNQACASCDRSNAAYDVRHTLSMNSVYELPFGPGKRFLQAGGLQGKLLGGWELSGMATARTGLPINIVVTRSASDMLDGNTVTPLRPDLVPGVPIYPANQSIDNWLNLAAFTVPAKYTWGNLGRNAAVGPGNYEIDTALEKKTVITERLAVKFRVEAFNVLNHPIFASPSALDITAPTTFGVITSPLNTGATGVGTPRRLEFMLRLEF